MSGHTPVPWNYSMDDAEENVLVLAPRADDPTRMRTVCSVPAKDLDDLEAWATARLIAAAPAMLEELRLLERHFAAAMEIPGALREEGRRAMGERLRSIRTIIAATTGKDVTK